MKIGLYGGTFNPIHYGHLRTAEEVYEILALDKVMFIPSGKTPFDKPGLEPAPHRYEMVKRATRDNRHFLLSDMEVKQRGKSFTVDTVVKLKKQFTDSRLLFIMGSDAFLDLPYWKQPGKLVEFVDLVIISRPGYPFTMLSDSPYIKGIKKKNLKHLDKGNGDFLSFDLAAGNKLYLCNVTEFNISASGIRERIRKGKNIRYLLPDSVKSYIISNKLYTNNGRNTGVKPLRMN